MPEPKSIIDAATAVAHAAPRGRPPKAPKTPIGAWQSIRVLAGRVRELLPHCESMLDAGKLDGDDWCSVRVLAFIGWAREIEELVTRGGKDET
jgi:hypothetical protein